MKNNRQERNFSSENYWNKLAKSLMPENGFCGSTKEYWETWRTQARNALMAALGDFPEKIPLDPLIISTEEDNGLIRQKLIINSEENMSIPCYLLYPKEIKQNRKNAAIVCCHGHADGDYGKEVVAGIRATMGHIRDIESMHSNYGERMARAGYLTICPDLRGFGERSDGPDPLGWGRDMCNVNFIKGALLGKYVLTLNIFDIMRCIDYLETRAEVDPGRIGMMGLSLGGTMTAFVSAIDERIKAADIICYINPFADFAIKNSNFCGSQMVPGIYRYLDTSDIAGLIAPRPLLIEMGSCDDIFPIADTMKGYEQVRKIYEVAGAAQMLSKDVCQSGHAFCDNKAYHFFKKHL